MCIRDRVYAGGTNASSQNPQITFNTLGLHTVTLVATNALGSDSEIKNNYINVTNVVGPCDATSTQTCAAADEFISNVTLNTINNSSACTGYSDFTAQSTTLAQGSAYNVTVVPTVNGLSLIHILRCRRYAVCRSRWSPYH